MSPVYRFAGNQGAELVSDTRRYKSLVNKKLKATLGIENNFRTPQAGKTS